MVESEEAAFEFFVSHEQFAEAVEPTMCHLHNPSPRFLCRVSAFVADFLAAAFDVGNVAVGLDDAQSRSAGIACVGAQMLATPLGCRRAREHEGIQHRLQLTDVMSVGAGHDQRQRNATTVYQQMSLAAIFSPDPSDWGRRLPVPAAPSSWRHQCFASAKRPLQGRRTRLGPRATAPRTHRPSAIREITGEPRWRSRTAQQGSPSIGIPCAGRKRWLQTPSGTTWVCDPRPACGHTLAPDRELSQAARAPRAPKTRPSLPTTAPSSSPWPYSSHAR